MCALLTFAYAPLPSLSIFFQALEILPGDSAADRQVQRSLRDAQRALKSAKRKDYYKILNVPRNAETAAIKKAYKKAALKWHPDRHANKGEAEQKKAEAMFKDVGEALAVLEDPQKRSMYDQGMDLEDIQNGGHGHGHGFGGGHGMGGAGGIDPNILFQMFMGQQGRGF